GVGVGVVAAEWSGGCARRWWRRRRGRRTRRRSGIRSQEKGWEQRRRGREVGGRGTGQGGKGARAAGEEGEMTGESRSLYVIIASSESTARSNFVALLVPNVFHSTPALLPALLLAPD